MKVHSRCDGDIVGSVRFGCLASKIHKTRDDLVHIVTVKIRIIHDGLIVAENVPAVIRRRKIVVVQDAGEQVALAVNAGLPDDFHGFVGDPGILIPE